MENNRAGQLRGLENFLLDNRPTSLDTILRLCLPGGPNSPLDENQFGQLHGVENAHTKSSNVANNQALLLLPDFGGPSNNNINGNGFGDPDHLVYYRFCGVPYPEFGHGIGGLPPVGLDHPWFSSQASSVDHLLDYRQQVDNNVPFIHNTSRRNEWSSSSRRRRRRNISVSNRVCTRCGTTKTPMWRRGPDGPQTNCNACGLWYSRLSKKPPGEKGNKLGVY